MDHNIMYSDALQLARHKRYPESQVPLRNTITSTQLSYGLQFARPKWYPKSQLLYSIVSHSEHQLLSIPPQVSGRSQIPDSQPGNQSSMPGTMLAVSI